MAQKVFIITGEFSGESHAARAVQHMRRRDPDLQVRAMGSELLEQAGAEIVVDYKHYSYSGVTEVIANLFSIFELKEAIIKEIVEFEPDKLVLVDYFGFNSQIAEAIWKLAKKGKIKKPKIIQYIAPQLWASRPNRIEKIKKYYDLVLCTLPFEEEIYSATGVRVEYVGSPVLSSLPPRISKKAFLEDFHNSKFRALQESNEIARDQARDIEEKEVLIGIFPGSRKSEIKHLMPILMEAASRLRIRGEKDKIKYKFIVARAPTITHADLVKCGLREKFVKVLDSKNMKEANHKLIATADILWLCSGTVTLEAALYATPYLLTYKSNAINYFLYQMFRKIEQVGLANIIVGKNIVKEFIQEEANSNNFVYETEAFLNKNALFNLVTYGACDPENLRPKRENTEKDNAKDLIDAHIAEITEASEDEEDHTKTGKPKQETIDNDTIAVEAEIVEDRPIAPEDDRSELYDDNGEMIESKRLENIFLDPKANDLRFTLYYQDVKEGLKSVRDLLEKIETDKIVANQILKA